MKPHWLSLGIGILIGIVVADTLESGVAGFVMLSIGLLSRWLLGKVAGFLFDDELRKLKKALKPKNQRLYQHARAWGQGDPQHPVRDIRKCRTCRV